MTSEQQVKSRFTDCEVFGHYFIKVMVNGEPYFIGHGTSRHRAFTDAMHKLGMRRIVHRGRYQKHRL